MASALNVRGPKTYMGLQASLLVSIFWASKLTEKGGETNEVGDEHVALPT